MRIARYIHDGRESWGFVDGDKVWTPSARPAMTRLLTGSLQELETLRDASDPAPLEEVRLLAPVTDPPQFIGIGLNYRDHAAEAGQPLPEFPLTFAFLPSAIIDPGSSIELPPFTKQVDWEAELGIVIGRGGKDIAVEDALDHVAGYVIVNDVSARDVQLAEGQWTRSKSFDTFKPMGPWIVTVDELGDASGLEIKLWVNGELKQSSNTDELIFDVPHLVSWLSRATTLQPGAVISSGTPKGVGFARTPAEYLQEGDEVAVEIVGIGRISNPVTSAS